MLASSEDFLQITHNLPQPNAAAITAARKRQAILTKPAGSLGKLESLGCWLSGWQATDHPRVENVQTLIFAGNHGITKHGISAFPPEVTAQMVDNFKAGGAAINTLANAFGHHMSVVALELENPTEDFSAAPAMSKQDCLTAINTGYQAVSKGADVLVFGEMGIGNTTAASAMAAAVFGGTGKDWAGPGTGLDSQGIMWKARLIDTALLRHREHLCDPFEIIRRLGGREMAAIAGGVLAARLNHQPVILDGFITTASVAPLVLASHDALSHCLAGHVSAEPAHRRILEKLELEPLLDLGMRLGEGTGASIAANILKAAAVTQSGMATFTEAGVAKK
jgi:nicotinate-nucleotide--dimethylbenzimidazole phosphoribosyltransferase